MAEARARSAGGHPAKAGLLSALWAAIVHAFPATLFLAAVLSALANPEPRWLAASTGTMMRALQDTQDRFSALWGATPRADRMKANFEGDRSVLVLEFTPEADSRFFLRTTPVPRQRLACVVDAFAGQLAELAEPGSGSPRPVVVIDFDVSTVRAPVGTTATQAWKPAVGEGGCLPRRPTMGGGCVASAGPGGALTVDDAMVCALLRLARQAQVVVPVFPRATPEDRVLRNGFLKRVCEAAARPAGPGRQIHLASAQAGLQSEVVFEYARALNTRNACGSATSCGNMTPLWPPEYPGMGNIAARLMAQRGAVAAATSPTTQAYCEQLQAGPAAMVFDDLLVDEAQPERATFYDTVRLEWPKVEKRIATVPLGVEGSPADGLAKESQRAFANVGPATAYFMGVDSGTGQDRYRTPLQATTVAGAWIHGAIALSELERLRPEGGAAAADGHGAGTYGKHVLTDVGFGLALVLLCTLLGRLPLQHRHPTLHGLIRVGGPAAVALLLWLGYVLYKSKDVGSHDWSNPLPVLVGLMVHIYLHAAEGEHDAAHDAHRAAGWSVADQLLTLGLRWLWITSIAVAATFGVTHGAPAGDASADSLLRLPDPLFAVVPFALPVQCWVGAAVFGALYVAAASRLRRLPIAWRSP